MSGEGPIVFVLIILLRKGLPFWGPYHIQKLKKFGVRTENGGRFEKIAHLQGFIFGNAH